MRLIRRSIKDDILDAIAFICVVCIIFTPICICVWLLSPAEYKPTKHVATLFKPDGTIHKKWTFVAYSKPVIDETRAGNIILRDSKRHTAENAPWEFTAPVGWLIELETVPHQKAEVERENNE